MLLTVLEIIAFMIAAAILGVLLGWVLRGLFSKEQAEISDLRAQNRKLKKARRELEASSKAEAATSTSTTTTKIESVKAVDKAASKPAAKKAPAKKAAKPKAVATKKAAVKKAAKPAAKVAKKAASKKVATKAVKKAKVAKQPTKAERVAAQASAKLGVADIIGRVGKSTAKDDLTKIHGIGPKFSGLLKGMGINSYQQISQFKKADVRTVSAALGSFSGRVERDNWVAGAKKVMKELKKK